jgi:hypothetical protein
MREPYICPYCDQRSTRWWNLKIHMKRKHGEYLPVGSSGQYTPDNPFWYKHPYDNIRSATVPDTVGNRFQPRYLPQQAPLVTSQYSASPMHPPRQIMDDQRYGTGLSRETILRIDELKRLANKYPQYCSEGLMQWAILCCNDGDNKILDDKLEQLRTIDSRLNGWANPV